MITMGGVVVTTHSVYIFVHIFLCIMSLRGFFLFWALPAARALGATTYSGLRSERIGVPSAISNAPPRAGRGMAPLRRRRGLSRCGGSLSLCQGKKIFFPLIKKGEGKNFFSKSLTEGTRRAKLFFTPKDEDSRS